MPGSQSAIEAVEWMSRYERRKPAVQSLAKIRSTFAVVVRMHFKQLYRKSVYQSSSLDEAHLLGPTCHLTNHRNITTDRNGGPSGSRAKVDVIAQLFVPVGVLGC